ncbi:Ribosomal RNA-processing protein 7 [Glycine soja]
MGEGCCTQPYPCICKEAVSGFEPMTNRKKREKPVLQKGVGWTVVLHHKGRKKTRDSESGIAVVSVAQAPVENKMAKKKHKGVGLDFYVQIKEVQRNEIMTLQCKFEEDKRRLQQLRAARKFRPY